MGGGGGGGFFELRNPKGRGGLQQFWNSRWKKGSKQCAFCHGGVDFFWNNPIRVKRVNRTNHLFPRFVNFKEVTKLTYDQLRFLFCAYFGYVRSHSFFTKILF